MGYTLRAFIGHTADVQILANQWPGAVAVDIEHNLSIVPMMAELYDKLNVVAFSESIAPFVYLTAPIEVNVLALIGQNSLGYVEADYFGGTGTQAAILWQAGERHWHSGTSSCAINTLLQQLGVTAGYGRDEFDTVGLGRHQMEDWLLP